MRVPSLCNFTTASVTSRSNNEERAPCPDSLPLKDRQLRTSKQAKEARLILSSSLVGLGVDHGQFHCPDARRAHFPEQSGLWSITSNVWRNRLRHEGSTFPPFRSLCLSSTLCCRIDERGVRFTIVVPTASTPTPIVRPKSGNDRRWPPASTPNAVCMISRQEMCFSPSNVGRRTARKPRSIPRNWPFCTGLLLCWAPSYITHNFGNGTCAWWSALYRTHAENSALFRESRLGSRSEQCCITAPSAWWILQNSEGTCVEMCSDSPDTQLSIRHSHRSWNSPIPRMSLCCRLLDNNEQVVSNETARAVFPPIGFLRASPVSQAGTRCPRGVLTPSQPA